MASMDQIKKLRQMTGCGIMDCKEALNTTNDSLEEAVTWLRKKGMAKAAKKADRESVEGVIGLVTDGAWGALLQISSETDFVARNETFQEFVHSLLDLAQKTKPTSKEAFLKTPLSKEKTVEEELTYMTSVIGELLTLKDLKTVHVSKGFVSSYLHNAYTKRLGKIGVLVGLETDTVDQLKELGQQLAMHVAASNPLALRREDLDADILEKERNVFLNDDRLAGKPEAAIAKVVEGRLRKFCSEVVFEEQPFIMDNKKSVKNILDERASQTPVHIHSFSLLKVG